jgi:hypothetical protein
MDELEKRKGKTQQAILTGILWIITVVLSVFTFLSGRRVVLDIYSRFFPGGIRTLERSSLSLLNILVSLPLAFLVIAIIIGGFEYHFRRAGTEESRWMFARTLAVEFGILILALFL